MSLLSLVLYIPLQIAFIPLALIGFVLVAYRQMVVSKKMGISQTAIEILNGRWTMHAFGIRVDPLRPLLVSVGVANECLVFELGQVDSSRPLTRNLL